MGVQTTVDRHMGVKGTETWHGCAACRDVHSESGAGKVPLTTLAAKIRELSACGSILVASSRKSVVQPHRKVWARRREKMHYNPSWADFPVRHHPDE